jgi:3-phenylpropionate/cinnamic acid dioxygenase small subunit
MNLTRPLEASDSAAHSDWSDEDEIPIGSPQYNEVLHFLYHEARLLDAHEIEKWAGMLSDELSYTAPIRVTRLASDRNASAIGPGHYDEDYNSILTRIARLTKTKSFWAEDPASRTRRFVSNVLVRKSAHADELLVNSYLLLTRSRLEMVTYAPLSAERRDILRLTDGKWKLRRREIIIDQSVVMMPNIAVFL